MVLSGAYLEGGKPAHAPPPNSANIRQIPCYLSHWNNWQWHESLKFGQLTLGKIIKIVATRCKILRLKFTKFNFGSGSAPDPAGGPYSTPLGSLAGLRGPTSKGRGREGDGKERGNLGEGGYDTPPLHSPLIYISGYAPGYINNVCLTLCCVMQ